MNLVIIMIFLAGVSVLAIGCANQGALKKSSLYSVTAEIMVPAVNKPPQLNAKIQMM